MRPERTLITLAVALLVLSARGLAAEPAPSPAAPAEAVLADLPKATWIADGGGRRVVYIFFDPNCPSCQLLYRNLRTFVASHNLQVRWIPVAVVDATSLGKAAAILQVPDRRAALRRNEERYQSETFSGGIEEEIPSDETEQQLRANELLLNRLDVPVVPTMLFPSRDGRAVIIQGALSPLALGKVLVRLP
ncbi:dihydroneopterin aldolase [Sulfurifustis variabilis]|uniref:Dihydroneopterin aldolase n=1 Tax=Sulfurifustis variabilis TaxID=1675686 RepID=A0A1C7AEU1_9GAMM|nr:thioredoxin fold domain-containing protein [Sulfurifustis variabilis]BAU49686.1 dihydroneopterin aldolase [Sulfurifustis variabilis]